MPEPFSLDRAKGVWQPAMKQSLVFPSTAVGTREHFQAVGCCGQRRVLFFIYLFLEVYLFKSSLPLTWGLNS